MSINEIVGKLKDPGFDANLRECLSCYTAGNPTDCEKIAKWVGALRDDLVTLINEIGDLEEIRMTLAVNYIEIKSRWIALNTKMNYQNFRTGSCDPVTALRGCGMSQLVALIEGLLTQQEIDQITEFLAEPIRRAA